MSQLLLPCAYALFVWWFSTGLVLYLVSLPARAHPWTMLGATGLLGLALYLLDASAEDTSAAGAYLAFTAAILVWAWAEVGFLTGYVTGPRRAPCQEGIGGWRRAQHAIAAILYHELALIALGAMVIAVTWDATNRFGAWTYGILWALRLSAKLNLFLGVPILNDEFLPRQLHHLKSYFTRKAMNPLFPVAVTASTAITALLAAQAIGAEADPFTTTGFALMAALAALGILEHWFMVLPLPVAALWSGAMRAQAQPAPTLHDILPHPASTLNRRRP